MSAAEILKLIETVDPDDTARLDEIDARVWCYLGGESWGNVEPVKFISFGPKEFMDDMGDMKIKRGLTFSFKGKYTYEKDYRDCEEFVILSKQFTRSRDIVKKIRPNNLFLRWSTRENDAPGCQPIYVDDEGIVNWRGDMMHMPTEELAELHATIQAIEYKRVNS